MKVLVDIVLFDSMGVVIVANPIVMNWKISKNG